MVHFPLNREERAYGDIGSVLRQKVSTEYVSLGRGRMSSRDHNLEGVFRSWGCRDGDQGYRK